MQRERIRNGVDYLQLKCKWVSYFAETDSDTVWEMLSWIILEQFKVRPKHSRGGRCDVRGQLKVINLCHFIFHLFISFLEIEIKWFLLLRYPGKQVEMWRLGRHETWETGRWGWRALQQPFHFRDSQQVTWAIRRRSRLLTGSMSDGSTGLVMRNTKWIILAKYLLTRDSHH